jgi:hypothetical protein
MHSSNSKERVSCPKRGGGEVLVMVRDGPRRPWACSAPQARPSIPADGRFTRLHSGGEPRVLNGSLAP